MTAWIVRPDDPCIESEKEVPKSEASAIEEIEARYAPDRVLIGNSKIDDEQRLLRGVVLFSGPDRDEFYREAMELDLDEIAIHDLGI